MASLCKPVVTEWVLGGRRVPAGTPGAEKRTRRQRKWYAQNVPGDPPGKRRPLSTDRKAAEKMLADLVRQAERGRAGLPTDLPLAPLLEEWAASIDGGETHKRECLNHARTVLSACEIRTLSDLRGRGIGVRVEAYARGLLAGDDPLSGRTAAAYAGHTRQFTRWLWRKRELLDADPLAGLDLPSQRPTTPRRDLTPEELDTLLRTTAASTRVLKGLTGEDRVFLYLVATYTGYRAGELAALTPAHFDLETDPPTVRLAADDTKDDLRAKQPIPERLAQSLRPYLGRRSRQDRVWRGQWYKKAPALLRADLAAAGLPARTAAGDAVFHSLRHSLSSMLAGVAGVKVHQDLMRHKDSKTTLDHYTHASDRAKADAVNALPLLGGGTVSPLAGLSRGELEGLTLGLLVALSTILGGKPCGT